VLDPIRERRAEALRRSGDLRDRLLEGSRKARTVAAETMARVRDAVKLSY
jgi:tryptophanyl-tRNA synthetase